MRLDIEGRYVAVTDEDVVVLSPDGDGRLQRVDPATHRTVGEPYHLGGSPTDLDAVADRAVEVTALPPQLHRFGPELDKPQTIDIETDGVPAELLLDGPDGWVTDSLYNEVIRFDATTGKALNKVKVALKPDGIADDGDLDLGRHPQRHGRAPRRQDREAAGADRHQGPALRRHRRQRRRRVGPWCR